jgi:hypothetical protein
MSLSWKGERTIAEPTEKLQTMTNDYRHYYALHVQICVAQYRKGKVEMAKINLAPYLNQGE